MRGGRAYEPGGRRLGELQLDTPKRTQPPHQHGAEEPAVVSVVWGLRCARSCLRSFFSP